jgi:hypothetical protein
MIRGNSFASRRRSRVCRCCAQGPTNRRWCLVKGPHDVSRLYRRAWISSPRLGSFPRDRPPPRRGPQTPSPSRRHSLTSAARYRPSATGWVTSCKPRAHAPAEYRQLLGVVEQRICLGQALWCGPEARRHRRPSHGRSAQRRWPTRLAEPPALTGHVVVVRNGTSVRRGMPPHAWATAPRGVSLKLSL